MLEKVQSVLPEIGLATAQTAYMLVLTLFIALVFGGALGIWLYVVRPDSLAPNRTLYVVLDGLVNLVRSFPFLILLISVIPLTRFVVGTSIGTTAVVVPLSISAIPEFARLVEQALLDVRRGVVEAGQAFGASRLQLIQHILLVEARPGLINAFTILSVLYLSATTVAGLVGGGGLGNFAITFGYYRYEPLVMAVTVLVIIIWVQLIQMTGTFFVRRADKRRR
ncbi:methionine ABC transporter permease [Mycolicibacterium sp. YH-1]|uniref:methionine ABC transporter permease n=1 Tax=Mycolicibacterium sp. YH-1 TaxID=2908837 RepID=UPI001F4BEFFB|nr:methionine ABC transporter permease [Mycolicibacterium sp. YH-1]UNB55801.1 ABC transporter permease [Mycolicibacterium sp. YH-1]